MNVLFENYIVYSVVKCDVMQKRLDQIEQSFLSGSACSTNSELYYSRHSFFISLFHSLRFWR